jgi:hypothetical protein
MQSGGILPLTGVGSADIGEDLDMMTDERLTRSTRT